MITRDVLMRQIHQFVQAVAQVLFHKQAGQYDEAQDLVAETVETVTGVALNRLYHLSKSDLLDLCTGSSGVRAEQAIALADLLAHDRTREGWQRALWLYEAALASGGVVPFDIHTRMDALRDRLA